MVVMLIQEIQRTIICLLLFLEKSFSAVLSATQAVDDLVLHRAHLVVVIPCQLLHCTDPSTMKQRQQVTFIKRPPICKTEHTESLRFKYAHKFTYEFTISVQQT